MLCRLLLLPVLPVLFLTGCNTGATLECPAPRLQSGNDELHETAADIKSYQSRFEDGYSENELGTAISALRQKYPDARDDAIFNYLVAAYCPVARGSSDFPSIQKNRLRSFESALHAALGD